MEICDEDLVLKYDEALLYHVTGRMLDKLMNNSEIQYPTDKLKSIFINSHLVNKFHLE